MTTLAFILYANNSFTPLTGQEENVIVRINKDGSGFSPATNSVNEFSPGYYSIILTDSELKCEQFVIVEITCTGAQRRVFCYTPDNVAKKVWEYPNRKLTNEIPDIPENPEYIYPNQ